MQVIHGDAGRLSEMLPSKWLGKISTVISGIPMVTLPVDVQQRFIDAWFDVLTPEGRMLQYTYSLVSPLPEAKLGVKGRRKGLAVAERPAGLGVELRAGRAPRQPPSRARAGALPASFDQAENRRPQPPRQRPECC